MKKTNSLRSILSVLLAALMIASITVPAFALVERLIVNGASNYCNVSKASSYEPGETVTVIFTAAADMDVNSLKIGLTYDVSKLHLTGISTFDDGDMDLHSGSNGYDYFGLLPNTGKVYSLKTGDAFATFVFTALEAGETTVELNVFDVTPDDDAVYEEGLVTVANDTEVNYYIPSYSYYNYSKTQYIIPASDLSAIEGDITALRWYMSNYVTDREFEVILTETEEITLSGLVDVSDGTVVYKSKTWSANKNNEILLNFDTPYDYNGGNLLVTVLDNTGSYKNGNSFYGAEVTNASCRIYSDSTQYYASDTEGGTVNSFVPKTTLYYTVAENGDVVTVAYGYDTSEYIPAFSLYNYAKAQYVIPASELYGVSGEITALRWYMENIVSDRTVAVILSEIEETTLSGLVDVSDGTLVYESKEWEANEAKEVYLEFDTPYAYNGGNLLVTVLDNTGSWKSGNTAYGVASEGAAAYVRRDSEPYSADYTKDCTLTDFIPQTALYYNKDSSGKHTVVFRGDEHGADYMLTIKIDDGKSITSALNNMEAEDGWGVLWPGIIYEYDDFFKVDDYFFDSSADNLCDFDDPVTSDLVLYAEWISLDTHTVTLKGDEYGDDVIMEFKVPDNYSINAASNAIAAVYDSFCFWPAPVYVDGKFMEVENYYYDRAGNELCNYEGKVTEDTVIYAQWREASTYTVTFKGDEYGPENMLVLEVPYGYTYITTIRFALEAVGYENGRDLLWPGYVAVGDKRFEVYDYYYDKAGNEWCDFSETFVCEDMVLYAQWQEAVHSVKSVTHEIANGKIIFTVVTAPGAFNRIKVSLTDNLNGYVGYTSSYEEDEVGNYVWTVKANAPAENTTYAFDLRLSTDGKYQKWYYYYDVEMPAVPEAQIKSASYKITDGKIVFTVVTNAGDLNRVKISSPENLSGYVVYTDKYTVNAQGDYVWTTKAITAPDETCMYAVDLRTTAGKYMRSYTYIYVEVKEVIVKSVTHSFSGSKLVFKVTTKPGDYNRIKAALASNPSGSLAVGTSYTVNADGDWVWTVKVPVPTETTQYVFDMRGTDGKYLKNYSDEYEVSMDGIIKYAKYTEYKGRLIFKVVTKAGDYNRLRCGLSKSTSDNLANGNTYEIDENGDYVWTVKVPKPEADTTLYFDLRNATTNKYLKEFLVYDYEYEA